MRNLITVRGQSTDFFNPPYTKMYGSGSEVYPNLETPMREAILGRAAEDISSIVMATPADETYLAAAYSQAYIDFIRNPPYEGLVSRRDAHGYIRESDASAWLDRNTYLAAKIAADVSFTASGLLPQSDCVYALCRPPGHHSGPDTMGGHCYFNNAALAAFRLRQNGFSVGILDVDKHAANGTYDHILGVEGITLATVHVRQAYPFDSTHDDYYNLSRQNALALPVDKDATAEDFLAECRTGLEWVGQQDLLLVSLGLDTGKHDIALLDEPGSWGFESRDFYELGAIVGSACRKTLIIQEGGYNLDYIARSLHAFLSGLENT